MIYSLEENETEVLFRKATELNARFVKTLNEDEDFANDPENPAWIALNKPIEETVLKLMSLPKTHTPLESCTEYAKAVLGNNYFADVREWDYLGDIIRQIEYDIA